LILDGFQRTPLVKLDGVYVASGAGKKIKALVRVYQTFNKRVTGVELYAAMDDGDTSAAKRLNPYYLYRAISLIDLDDVATFWERADTGGYFILTEPYTYLTQSLWDNKGDEWSIRSGYVLGTDTMYSIDTEVSAGKRQWLARVYRYTDGREDLDNIYTNPRNIEGLVQPDIFSDEQDIFRHRVLYGDNTFITGLISNERGSLIAFKDKAIAEIITNENPDGTIVVETRLISDRIGCSSIKGYIQTTFGVFFNSFDDIYVLSNNGLEPLTSNDWLNVYRQVSEANKQNCIVWFRPDEQAIFFKLGSSVYAFYLKTRDWRQVEYADTLAGFTVKRDGTFVWWKSGGTAYKFDTSETDAGTAIAVSFDTGYFPVSDKSESMRMLRAFINKNTASGSGTLGGSLYFSYEGTVNSKTYSTLSTSSRRIPLGLPVTLNTWCDEMRMTYNPSLGETGTVEFGEVELHGIPFQKKKVV